MSPKSRRSAGTILVIFPTALFGGVSLLRMLMDDPAYQANALRQDLWRAGHAHAAVLLVLSLVLLRYVDEANLSERWKELVRAATPFSAILISAAFFLSVLSADATEPNRLIWLAFVGAALLATGLITLGVGLLRGGKDDTVRNMQATAIADGD